MFPTLDHSHESDPGLKKCFEILKKIKNGAENLSHFIFQHQNPKFQFQMLVFNLNKMVLMCFVLISGLIHGDLNDLNLLVQPKENGAHRLSGIVDFGDMHIGYYIYELAITIVYMMMEHPNPIEVGGPVLAGWESILPLNEAEKDCLYMLVTSRFCQSSVIARYSVLLHPENAEYLTTSKKGIPLLHQLWARGKEEVEKVWFEGASQYSDEWLIVKRNLKF